MDFETLEELEKYLEKEISDSLHNDVAKKVVKLNKEHIQKDVYKAYNPTHYIRTNMLLESAIAKRISKDTIELLNLRRGEDGKNVPLIIETGKGYTWNGNLDERIGSRPFMERTYNDLAGGKAKLFFKVALTKRGFKVEE